MIAVQTKHDMMLNEIMEFTGAVVSIAQMPGVDVVDKANAILLAEQVFHKIIMDNMSNMARTAVACSSN